MNRRFTWRSACAYTESEAAPEKVITPLFASKDHFNTPRSPDTPDAPATESWSSWALYPEVIATEAELKLPLPCTSIFGVTATSVEVPSKVAPPAFERLTSSMPAYNPADCEAAAPEAVVGLVCATSANATTRWLGADTGFCTKRSVAAACGTADNSKRDSNASRENAETESGSVLEGYFGKLRRRHAN